MIKTLITNKGNINFKFTFKTLCIFKQEFKQEYFSAVNAVTTLQKNKANIRHLITAISLLNLKLAWCMAITADSTDCDFNTWSNQPYIKAKSGDIATLAYELLQNSLSGVDNSDKDSSGEFSAENLIACCLKCGLSVTDIADMELSFILNTLSEYMDIGKKDDTPKTREATQDDYDAF